MASDETQLRRLYPQLPLDIGVSLTRRLVVLDAVHAEAPIEKIDNAAVFKLTCLNLSQVVGEGEQAKSCVAQLAQRCRHPPGAAASSKISP